ncbi:MAG: hypothetical protein ACI4DN_12105 [Lachnospiraceae bacterium]
MREIGTNDKFQEAFGEQVLWGKWRITEILWGGGKWNVCDEDDFYKDFCFYLTPKRLETDNPAIGKGVIELPSYYVAVYAPWEPSQKYIPWWNYDQLGIEGDYFIYLHGLEDDNAALDCYLINNEEMIVFQARHTYKAKKVGPYEGRDKNKMVLLSGMSDLCTGLWRIIERTDKEDEQDLWIGEMIEIGKGASANKGLEIANGDILIDTGTIYCDISELEGETALLADEYGISKRNSFLVSCVFDGTVYWDRMIVVDGNNVIFQKGEVSYLAERQSDISTDLQ